MVKDMFPCIAMILVQVGYAGMNVISKLAMDSGMNPFVMVTYRQIFATAFILPLAFMFERKIMPSITKSILFQIFLSSILGATANQALYFVGLKYSTPTIACALTNLLPAFTFIMALPFGMETVGIKKRSGQAKVIGTIVCVGGAMLMSFYKGNQIKLGESGIHWAYAEKMNNSGNGQSSFLGPMLVVGSCLAWAAWFIIQTKMGETFSAPYTSSGLMCFMASIQCGIIGVFTAPSLQEWSLNSLVRATAVIYCGAIGSAFAFVLMSWCIKQRGPLYVSMFNPLLLVIVAVVGWAILDEKLYIGSGVGSILIIIGLYAVLWGKGKEMEKITSVDVKSLEEGICDEHKKDIELQSHNGV